jgi:hypothetical protein
MSTGRIETILVYVGSNPDDAIGENILKLPFLRALRTSFPAARITWIAGVGPCNFKAFSLLWSRGLSTSA